MKNGRAGQAQHGVDISGRPSGGASWAGVQCKGKDNYSKKGITRKELLDEVAKARSFRPPLSEWIIATSGEKDAGIEELARQITTDHCKKGLFTVHVWAWRDIVERLEDFPEIIQKHYPFLNVNTTTTSSQLDELKETTQGILEHSVEISDSISSLPDKLAMIVAGKDSTSSGLTHADGYSVLTEYQAELDHSRDLLNSYKYKDCIAYLEKLKSRIWSSVPSIIKFRLLTNMGAAKFKLDENEEAAHLFLEALQYNPDDEKAIANAALGYLLIGDFEAARTNISRLLERNPANSTAYCIYIQIPLPDTTLDSAISKVPEAFRHVPEVAYALSITAYNNDKHKESQFWLETAIQNDKENIPDLRGTLGGWMLDSLLQHEAVITHEQLNDRQRSKVLEARRLLTEAWERVVETDLGPRKLSWLVNRSIANKLLGDLDGSIKDLETALAVEPSNPVFIKHRAILAYLNKDSEHALTLLRGILQAKETPEAALVFSDILLAENRAQEAVDVLQETLLNADIASRLKDDAKRSLIDAYVKLKQYDRAQMLSDELRSLDSTEILNLASAAQIARLTGKSDEALSLLNEAKKYITEPVSYSRLMALGEEYYALEQYGEAANVYEKIANKNLDTSLTRRLLNSYYRFGKLSPALAICRNLREQRGPLPFITHIESAIYEEIDDFAQAKETCQVYLVSFPNDPEMILRLAVLNWRSKNFEELDAYLDSSPNVNELPLKNGLQLAHLYSVRGKVKECFDIIYELRRRFYNYPEAHLEYVRLFFERAKDKYEWLVPQTIKADVAVRIEDTAGEKEWFVIEDRKDTDFGRKEINLGHPLAQRLLNRTLGENVVIKEGLHSEEIGKVIELKSKYLYALHETFAIYEKMFPDVGGLWMISVGEPAHPGEMPKGFSNIFDSVSRQQERGTEVERYYKEGKLTIGSIAGLLQIDVVKAWNTLRGNPDVGVRCARGDNEERDYAYSLISTRQPKLTIDLISLLTIHSLNIADNIAHTFGRLLISQSTVEVLQNCIRERRGLERHGFMTIGKEGEQFVRSEVTAKDVSRAVDYFEAMIAWIDENCEIVPVEGALDIPRERKEPLTEMLGAASLDTLLIAKDTGALLFSDDERLRTFAKSEFDIDGVWTQILLLFSSNEKIIEQARYIEATLSLVCSHYYHTSIDSGVLLEAAKQSDWLPSYPYTEVIKSLQEGRANEESSLQVATLFLYELWKQPILPSRRDYLVYSLLDALAAGRNANKVIDKLTRLVKARFFLLPLEVVRLTNLFELWKRMHLVL